MYFHNHVLDPKWLKATQNRQNSHHGSNGLEIGSKWLKTVSEWRLKWHQHESECSKMGSKEVKMNRSIGQKSGHRLLLHHAMHNQDLGHDCESIVQLPTDKEPCLCPICWQPAESPVFGVFCKHYSNVPHTITPTGQHPKNPNVWDSAIQGQS